MKLTWHVALTALILIGSIALAQDAPAASPAPDKAAAGKSASDNTASPASNSAAGPEYVIGPDDVLHVAVWKEADLTATLPVRPDGKISLPLLNDVQAAGLTPEQLSQALTEKLKKYISDPRVTVVVTSINSKRIYLTGEVMHSGATPMLPNMTVLQALSSAGISQFANTKRIYVLRTENGKQEKLPVNYQKLVKGEQIEQNYLLQPGDTIVVP
ncbi:MAG: polysaccharide biosynthesis/export family protein [Terriglobales bacterium]|jgi:polysaccharide export outer membrane protein